MPTPFDLTAFLEAMLPEMLAFLESLVNVNSFTRNPSGVAKVVELTAAAFASLGFEARIIPSENPEFGPHLFLHRPGTGGKRMLLVTHSDTVFPPEEEERENFHWRPETETGRIYGPGTIDIKGGTAMILFVLQTIKHFEPEAFERTNWIVAANASEEVMSNDFARRCKEQTEGSVDAVLVFEGGVISGNGKIYHFVTARKGKADLRVTVQGRASHSGGGHKLGRNAIVQLSDIIARASAITDYVRNLTVNVGVVRGGTVVNRVPHFAEIDLEMRAFTPEAFISGLERLLGLGDHAPVVPDCKTTVKLLGRTSPLPESPEALGLMEVFSRAAQELGLTVQAEHRGGLSDANYLSALGPTLDGLGPDGDNDHCSQRSEDGSRVPEYIDTTTIVPKAALNSLAILKML